MGTLTTKLTMSSKNLTSDALNLSLSKILTVAGDARLFKVVTSNTKANLLLAANYGKSYVYLKNMDTSIVISIGMDTESDDTIDNDATDIFMTLGAGEFAFFPWAATYNLHVDAASGTPTLEVGVFEVA
tara:strand:+ start:660 stop:1046 length:387 start_codon:yes stop_codon:yes gene_type:complete